MTTCHADGLAISAVIEKLRIELESAGKEALLDELENVEGVRILTFLNAHGFNLAWQNSDLRRDLATADWLLRDGIGIAILLRLAKRDAGLNLNGTDLIPQLLERYRGRRVLFMGSQSPWLENAAETARRRFQIQVAAVVDGFQEDDHYLRCMRECPADLVVLAMGNPRQERVARLLRQEIEGNVLIVNGGGILDFMSGKVRRAPVWARKCGLEWMFRLVQEFDRLWRRYLVGNVVFLARAVVTSFTLG